MRPLTIGVLASVASAAEQVESPSGSLSSADEALESRVDYRSGQALAAAVLAAGHQARLIPVDDDLDLSLRQAQVDGCLVALHGRRGGAGDVQALLSVRQIPFMGPRGTSASIAFDKVRARHLLGYHNLPVAPAVVLSAHKQLNERALELLGWPCFVKPRRGALGLGVALLESPGQVREALERAMAVDDELLLERAFPGREVQVIVVDGRPVGAAEILTDGGPEGGAELICPPRLSRGRLDGVQRLARQAVAAVGLDEGPCRVDILVHDRHNEIILEVEPLPPLHQTSTTSRVLRAAGLSVGSLVTTWLDRLQGVARRATDPAPDVRPPLQ